MLFIGFVTDTNAIIYRTRKYHLSPEQYQTEDLESYPKAFLIEIIKWYEQQQQQQQQKQAVVKSVVHEVKAITKAETSKNYYSPQLSSDSPRQVTINECLTILQETKSLTFEDLIKQACQQNQQVAAYIGTKYLTKENVKLRPVLAQLLEHSNVKRTNQKPIVMSYI